MIKRKNAFSGFPLAILLIGMMSASTHAAVIPIGAHASISGTVNSHGNCIYLNGQPLCTGMLSPVQGCTVSVHASGVPLPVVSYTAITDKVGHYSIDSIPITQNGDAFQVVASAGPSYSVGRQEMQLSNGQSYTANFNLELSFTNTSVVTNDSLTFTISTDKKSYTVGDSMYVSYKIHNASTHAIQYRYTPGCDFDLLLKGISGDTLYRFLKNKACITLMNDGSIAADSSVTKRFAWVLVTNAMDSIVSVTASATTPSFGKTAASVNVTVKKQTVAVSSHGVGKKPFSPQLLFAHDKKLVLSLAKGERVSIVMFALSGQKIKQVLNRHYLPAGDNAVNIAGWYCAESVTILQIRGESFSISRAIHSGKCDIP
jgi:hypothetical protein